jgi:carboxylesterase
MATNLIPTAEPFFFPGDETGCLLIHGFTGTPKEMRWMGEYLSQAGHTVLGIRLAGHATCMEDMVRTRWQDWLSSVEDGYYLLRNATKRIFLMGLSMGGVLSLLFAAKQPVAGVVAMSTPYELPKDPRLRFVKWLHWFYPSVPKGAPDWHDPEAAKDHVHYPVYPTRAIAELRDLLTEMRASLVQVRTPVLLIHSRQDRGVLPENANKIYERLGSQEKEILWLEQSGHVITREPERLKVFTAALQFIHRITQNEV